MIKLNTTSSDTPRQLACVDHQADSISEHSAVNDCVQCNSAYVWIDLILVSKKTNGGLSIASGLSSSLQQALQKK